MKPRRIEEKTEKQDQKSKDMRSNKGLTFVDIKLNGKPLWVLVDTNATHNFVAGAEVERLKISLEKDSSRIKIVNSEAQPIIGITKSIPIIIGVYEE